MPLKPLRAGRWCHLRLGIDGRAGHRSLSCRHRCRTGAGISASISASVKTKCASPCDRLMRRARHKDQASLMRVAGHWLAVVMNEMQCGALPGRQRIAQANHDLADCFVRAFRYGVALHKRIDDDGHRDRDRRQTRPAFSCAAYGQSRQANVARDHKFLIVDGRYE